MKHKWRFDDVGIYVCSNCGMYRCEAERYEAPQFMRLTHPHADVFKEYSTPAGAVIALNPELVPKCVNRIWGE